MDLVPAGAATQEQRSHTRCRGGWSLRNEDGAAGVPKALRSSCQGALLPGGLPPRQGMILTSLSSR